MIKLEKNAKLSDMMVYVYEHIEIGDYDPAANTLRKIGEHMAKCLVIDVNLWDEARTNQNGKKFSQPNYASCISILRKNRVISKDEYDEVFMPLQRYGNGGSHEVSEVSEAEVKYTAEKTKKYLPIFLNRYPNYARHGILPDPSNHRGTTNTPPATRPKHEHRSSGWRIIKPSGCTETGERQRVCLDCGQVLERQAIQPAGHSLSKWITRKPATTASNGIKEIHCTKCGAILKTEVIPQIKDAPPKERISLNRTTTSTVKNADPKPSTDAFLQKNDNEVIMAAAYALGIIAPDTSLKKKNELIVSNNEAINKKIAEWNQYGHIVAMTMIRDNATIESFWLITDKHALIIAPIKRNLLKPGHLFSTVWSVGGFGRFIPSKKVFSIDDYIGSSPRLLIIDNEVKSLSFDYFITSFYQQTPKKYPWDSYCYYCESLRWVKRMILPSHIKFEGNLSYASYQNPRLELFSDGLQIDSSDWLLPYYIENRIIRRTSDKREVYCLNGSIINKRKRDAKVNGGNKRKR